MFATLFFSSVFLAVYYVVLVILSVLIVGVSGSFLLEGATPGPRKQTSVGRGLINISVITETGDNWEGRCAGVSHSAK